MLTKLTFAAALQAAVSLAEDLPQEGLRELQLKPLEEKPIIWKWKPRRAVCKMHWDVSNPTTNPYGKFYLYQATPSSDVMISGWMK